MLAAPNRPLAGGAVEVFVLEPNRLVAGAGILAPNRPPAGGAVDVFVLVPNKPPACEVAVELLVVPNREPPDGAAEVFVFREPKRFGLLCGAPNPPNVLAGF